MKAASSIDQSILPEQARQELNDFYRFLVGKYVRRRQRNKSVNSSSPGTAGALVASGIVGIWKERTMDDSPVYASFLREKAQLRNLS